MIFITNPVALDKPICGDGQTFTWRRALDDVADATLPINIGDSTIDIDPMPVFYWLNFPFV